MGDPMHLPEVCEKYIHLRSLLICVGTRVRIGVEFGEIFRLEWKFTATRLPHAQKASRNPRIFRETVPKSRFGLGPYS